MSLIPKVYKSSDPGAPVLTGQAGSLVSLLDAVLINGYGSGADVRAPAGWSVAFTGANKRVYRNHLITASGTHLRVDDSAITGNARHAWLRCYSYMSNIDSGDYRTPSAAELANGAMWTKSNVLGSAARPWMIVANERWMYFHASPDGGGLDAFAGVAYAPFFAGDFETLRPGDPYNFALSGTGLTSWAGGRLERMGLYAGGYEMGSVRRPEIERKTLHLLGSYNPLASSARAEGYVPGDHIEWNATTAYFGAGSMRTRPDGPSAVSGGYTFTRFGIVEAGSRLRGFLPNVYVPLENLPFAHGEVQHDVSGFAPGDAILPWLWSSWWEAPTASWDEVGMVVYNIARDEQVP